RHYQIPVVCMSTSVDNRILKQFLKLIVLTSTTVPASVTGPASDARTGRGPAQQWHRQRQESRDGPAMLCDTTGHGRGCPTTDMSETCMRGTTIINRPAHVHPMRQGPGGACQRSTGQPPAGTDPQRHPPNPSRFLDVHLLGLPRPQTPGPRGPVCPPAATTPQQCAHPCHERPR